MMNTYTESTLMLTDLSAPMSPIQDVCRTAAPDPYPELTIWKTNPHRDPWPRYPPRNSHHALNHPLSSPDPLRRTNPSMDRRVRIWGILKYVETSWRPGITEYRGGRWSRGEVVGERPWDDGILPRQRIPHDWRKVGIAMQGTGGGGRRGVTLSVETYKNTRGMTKLRLPMVGARVVLLVLGRSYLHCGSVGPVPQWSS